MSIERIGTTEGNVTDRLLAECWHFPEGFQFASRESYWDHRSTCYPPDYDSERYEQSESSPKVSKDPDEDIDVLNDLFAPDREVGT